MGSTSLCKLPVLERVLPSTPVKQDDLLKDGSVLEVPCEGVCLKNLFG